MFQVFDCVSYVTHGLVLLVHLSLKKQGILNE